MLGVGYIRQKFAEKLQDVPKKANNYQKHKAVASLALLPFLF